MSAQGKKRCVHRENFPVFSNTSLGFLIAGAGQLIATFDPVFVRLSATSLVDTDGWVVIFWRYFLMAIMLTLSMIFVYKERFVSVVWHSLDRYGVAAALANTCCNVGYTWALQLMPAANTIVVFSSCPMITAVLSRMIFKEPMPLRVVIIVVSSFMSVFCVFAGELRAAGALGFGLALEAAAGMAVYMVICYKLSVKDPSRTTVPSLWLSAMVNALIGIAAAKGDVGGITRVALGWFFAQGAVLPLWMACLSISTTFITAVEANMVLLLDPILAPFWVWLSGFEAPPKFAMAGGCALAACLLLHARWNMLEMRKTQLSPSSMTEPLLAA